MQPAPIPFDGIGTFLVFLISVPALVIQSMSPEVRRAVMRRPGPLLLQTFAPLAAAVLIVVVALRVRSTWGEDDFIWTIVLLSLFAIAIATTVYMLNRYGRQDAIIHDLVNQVTRPLSREPRLNEKSLQTLLELGEQSAPGEDKQLVLEALYVATDRVCAHPAYRGDALETLINRLVDILASDSQRGDAKNFITAADLLERITTAIGARATTEMRWADLGYTIHTLSQLSHIALAQMDMTTDIEKTLMKCIQSLRLAVSQYPPATTEVSESLFKIGAVAIEKHQPLAATNALDKLFALVEMNQPAQGELVADTLGLAAHFWVAGSTARAYATEKLSISSRCLAMPLPEAFERARQHCVLTAQFDTADHLFTMIQEYQ